VLATGFRPAPLILPIVSSEKTSRDFMQRCRPYRIGDIGDIGAAFCDRTVAITTLIIGWLMAIGHISTKPRLGERPLLPRIAGDRVQLAASRQNDLRIGSRRQDETSPMTRCHINVKHGPFREA